MEEEWRDIKGYEGLYQVSNLGNVKSLGNGKSNNYLNNKPRILKQKNRHKQNKYLFVRLCKEGISQMYAVHKLVANTFLENPDNLPCVNHKDENKHNNYVDNLEFCTFKYNSNYGTAILRQKEKTGTKIKCKDLETEQEIFFLSANDAAKFFNTCHASIIRSMNKYKSPYKNRYIFSEIKNEED